MGQGEGSHALTDGIFEPFPGIGDFTGQGAGRQARQIPVGVGVRAHVHAGPPDLSHVGPGHVGCAPDEAGGDEKSGFDPGFQEDGKDGRYVAEKSIVKGD